MLQSPKGQELAAGVVAGAHCIAVDPCGRRLTHTYGSYVSVTDNMMQSDHKKMLENLATSLYLSLQLLLNWVN